MHGRSSFAFVAAAALLAACTSQAPEQAPEQAAAPVDEPRSTRVSSYIAGQQAVELTDTTIGWVESKATPMLTAEVPGRLLRVRVDAGDRVEKGMLLAEIDPAPHRSARAAAAADVERLQALTENQQRQAQRHERMLAEGFIASSMYEESRAQLRALQEQLRAAQARLESAERDLANTRVIASVSGEVDQRLVTAGDFVQTGQPLLRLVSGDVLRIHLPFPETVAGQLRAGLPVLLETPLAPAEHIAGEIRELRPALSRGRAIEAIVEVPNPGSWRAGASVRGTVILDRRDSVMLPEAAVIARPAGRTVYVIDGAAVRARLVEIGRYHEGKLEILSGVAAGERVALDGAGFLTDGARVSVQEPRS